MNATTLRTFHLRHIAIEKSAGLCKRSIRSYTEFISLEHYTEYKKNCKRQSITKTLDWVSILQEAINSVLASP